MKNKKLKISLIIGLLITIFVALYHLGNSVPKTIEVTIDPVFRFNYLINKEYPKELPWNLQLVNRDNMLDPNQKFDLITLENGKQIDTRIYQALTELFEDAKSLGYAPFVREAYRSYDDQVEMMNYYIDYYQQLGYSEARAIELAESIVALPNTSEHQIALAVDINNEDKESRALYAWLDENAYKYGFVKRYASDKVHITGISNEPWHYRYVGVNDALMMEQYNLCLEEYIDYLSHLDYVSLYNIDYCLDLYRNMINK